MFLQEAYTPTFNGYNSTDLHAWVVLENGKIMDYPIKTLKDSSFMGTEKLKYVPFDEKHQQTLYDRYEYKLSVKYNEFVSLLNMDKQEADKHFMVNGGYCMYRAIVIHKKLKEMGKESKVVFGSLGFVQPSGRVFYEFG